MREHLKVFEGGKEVWRLLDGFGRPGREVETVDWDLDSYVNYCLYPVQSCINRMREGSEDESVIAEYADILDRLYDSAQTQLRKLNNAIHKDLGRIKITTVNEPCRGGFMQQDFLEVVAEEKKSKVEAVG